MRIIIVDTETTGLDEKDQIVELAIITLVNGKQSNWHTLVKPTVPVTVGARAAHHITDAMLADAPSVSELPLEKFKADFFVAHNAKFDLQMLAQSGIPQSALPNKTICTYRCALHMWPEAEGHSNQVLRYHLGIDVSMPKDLPPHRALPDALITTAIFRKALVLATTETMVGLTTKPALLRMVNFGQHRGKLWADIAKTDRSYLQWILKKDFNDDVMHTAEYWLKKPLQITSQGAAQKLFDKFEYCKDCEGKGWRLVEITNHGERNELVRETCASCKGTGK